MWNRHGALLTIADCFRPALGKLRLLADAGIVWADCEALERRHNLGHGTLVVLDVVQEEAYTERRAFLEARIESAPVLAGEGGAKDVPANAVLLIPSLGVDHAEALEFYQRLRAANRVLGCDFFEGVVMKRADSICPVQLRSPLMPRALIRVRPAHEIPREDGSILVLDSD